MEYNSATKRLVTGGFSFESDFCGNSNSNCSFVTMLENDNLDVKWSMTLDGSNVSYNDSRFLPLQSISFSDDGSLVAVMINEPFSITLMNALTGEVRASI